MGRSRHFMKNVLFFICFLCAVTLLVKCYYANKGIESPAIDGRKYSRDKYFELQDEIEKDSKKETMNIHNESDLKNLFNESVGDDSKKIGEMKNDFSSDFLLQNENIKLEEGESISIKLEESEGNSVRLDESVGNSVKIEELEGSSAKLEEGGGNSVKLENDGSNSFLDPLGNEILADSREEDNILFVRAIGSKHFKKHDENEFNEDLNNNYGNAPTDVNYMQTDQKINITEENKNVSSSSITNDTAFPSMPKESQQNISNYIKEGIREFVSVPALFVKKNNITNRPVDNNVHDLDRRISKHNRQSIKGTTIAAFEDDNNNHLDLSAMDSFGKVDSMPEYELPILKNNSASSTSSTPILSERQAHLNHKYSSKMVVDIGENRETKEGIEGSKATRVTEKVYNDQPMSGVVIIGKPNNTRSYAVFSTTSDNRESVNFVFLVPLTALAWKRAGFDSIVIVVGSADEWKADPFYNFVLTYARKMDAVFIFLEPRPEKSIMISQVARLFAGNILRTAFTGMDDVYLVTSDADIWPIYGDAYVLPQGADILSLNSECCSPFKHRGKTHRMLPMANVGMKIRTWRSMTTKFGEVPNNIDDILTLFVREFGNVALRSVRKGDNIGWFLDQMMVSLLISNWAENNDRTRIRYVPRQIGIDRIDRNNWDLGSTIQDKIDSHLPLDTFIPGVWVRLNGLIRAMYGNGSRRFHWCIEYYEQFQELFVSKFRHGG